jgi:hypothetical protein
MSVKKINYLVTGCLGLMGFFLVNAVSAQIVRQKKFKTSRGVQASASSSHFTITWPTDKGNNGRLVLSLKNDEPLFSRIELSKSGVYQTIIENVDPQFIITEGKRDLVSQNGWNIFFDKVPLKPHQSYKVEFHKKDIDVNSSGSRTVITMSGVEAPTLKATCR